MYVCMRVCMADATRIFLEPSDVRAKLMARKAVSDLT